MQAISGSPHRPFQFGLRELLIWVTLAAIALSIFTTWNQAIGLWFVAYALAFRCPRTHVRNTQPVKSRRIALRKSFWRVVWFALPLAACLNLVTFCETYRTTWVGTDGDCYCIGWPILFRVDGYGYAGRYLHYNFIGLQVDLAVCVGITAATGLALRDGGRRLATTTVRFLRGRQPDTASPLRPGKDILTCNVSRAGKRLGNKGVGSLWFDKPASRESGSFQRCSREKVTGRARLPVSV